MKPAQKLLNAVRKVRKARREARDRPMLDRGGEPLAYLQVAEHPDNDDLIVGVRIATHKPVSLKTLKALVAWAQAQGCAED